MLADFTGVKKAVAVVNDTAALHIALKLAGVVPGDEVCKEYKIEMVEDAAESLGSYYKGRHTGNWGKLSILSFNGNKTITTGDGGAIITNDEALAKLAKHLTSTAKIPHRWEYRHDHIGYNYRLPNLNAPSIVPRWNSFPDSWRRREALPPATTALFKAWTVFAFSQNRKIGSIRISPPVLMPFLPLAFE